MIPLTPWTIRYRVKRRGSTFESWVKSPGPVMFAVVVRRPLFRRPVVRIELHSSVLSPAVVEEVAVFDHVDTDTDAHFEAGQ